MININKNNTADSRTCDWSKVKKDQLLNSTKKHIQDVKNCLKFISEKLFDIAHNHDYTKLKYIDDFYRNFKTGFKEQDWWERHQKEERHHLKKKEYIHEDVNLLDILEMIVDGISAGIARSNKYIEEPIPIEVLELAYKNTIRLILNQIIKE